MFQLFLFSYSEILLTNIFAHFGKKKELGISLKELQNGVMYFSGLKVNIISFLFIFIPECKFSGKLTFLKLNDLVVEVMSANHEY